MKISLLSLGNLGTAVAHLLAINGHEVLAWEYDLSVVNEVNASHHNSRYLPGVALHPQIRATNDINEAMIFGSLLVSCLPSRFVLPVLQPVAGLQDASVPVVNMGKGMHPGTGQTIMQMLAQLFPGCRLAMLCGPSLANEMVHGVNTVLVAASTDSQLPLEIKAVFDTDRITVMPSVDMAGVELAAIFKNAYAAGLGFVSAAGRPGRNLVGAFLTCALMEMCRVGQGLGADASTFYGYAGLGDLLATALSDKSHNFTFGKMVGDGMTLAQVQDAMGILPEGINTLQGLLALAREKGLDLPLANLLHEAFFDGLSVHQFLQRFNACLY